MSPGRAVTDKRRTKDEEPFVGSFGCCCGSSFESSGIMFGKSCWFVDDLFNRTVFIPNSWTKNKSNIFKVYKVKMWAWKVPKLCSCSLELILLFLLLLFWLFEVERCVSSFWWCSGEDSCSFKVELVLVSLGNKFIRFWDDEVLKEKEDGQV